MLFDSPRISIANSETPHGWAGSCTRSRCSPDINRRRTTLRYIHLSGRELSSQLNRSMAHVHAQRVSMLTQIAVTEA